MATVTQLVMELSGSGVITNYTVLWGDDIWRDGKGLVMGVSNSRVIASM